MWPWSRPSGPRWAGRPRLAPDTHPVPCLATFLSGAWRLDRRILDARECIRGRLSGAATFTPSADGLDYTEKGTLALGAHLGEATQQYRFRLEGPGAEVLFADGRPFYRLDLRCGEAAAIHSCPPDVYRGRFQVFGPDRWACAWRVEGPRKRLVIRTVLTRI